MAERFIINNFNLGGLAESAYQGKPNSLAEIVGCDIHSEPGILKASRALELAPTQSPITGMPRAGKGLVASDNSVYFFTKDDSYPRIWKEDSPTWTTYAPSDLLAVQDAAEYRGFIFFTHTAKLGYFEVGTSPGGATIDWQTGMSSSHKPMLVKTGKLWIGNGNLLQQVTTSSNPATSINDYDAPATELTFEAYETITAIGEIGSDLLVATTLPYGCKIRRIDTGDVAVISEDFIPEYKISLFLPSDNVVLCVTELHGNVYQYDGYQLHKIFRQQNTNIDNRIVTIEENAQTARLGISYYGVSSAGPSVTPDGVCGTYSMGAASANLPTIINQEFIPSPGLTDLIKVHGLLNNNSSGLDDLLYVAWEDDTVGATQEYGIDKLSSNRYDGAYFTTMVIDTNRIMLKHFKIYVNYRSLASGTDITIYSKVNNGSWTEVTSVNDATRNFKFGSVDVIEAATLQVKVELTTSGEDTPEIESLVIDAS